jgi:hypothetical protein
MGIYPTNRKHCYKVIYKGKLVPEIKFCTLQVYEGGAVKLETSLSLAVDKRELSA